MRRLSWRPNGRLTMAYQSLFDRNSPKRAGQVKSAPKVGGISTPVSSSDLPPTSPWNDDDDEGASSLESIFASSVGSFSSFNGGTPLQQQHLRCRQLRWTIIFEFFKAVHLAFEGRPVHEFESTRQPEEHMKTVGGRSLTST